MAQQKKYKLGELEFETEQEYRDAAMDLKRIKGIVDKYNPEDPQQAQKILASIKAHPETFRSPYGVKFREKLEAAAARAAVRQQTAGQNLRKQRKKKEESFLLPEKENQMISRPEQKTVTAALKKKNSRCSRRGTLLLEL